MTSRRDLLAPLLLASALLGGCGSSGPGATTCEPASLSRGPAPLEPYAQARALGRGVNFGNLMDASPREGSWTGGLVIEESHFDIARQGGFDSVRIPIRFSAHAARSAPYTIDPAFLCRVDQVVGWGLQRNLRIVIDLHHYEELFADPQAHRARFVAIWRQLAQRYTNYPGALYYELLNEPNGNLTVQAWNDIAADAIAQIRAVDDYHTVIVGAASWSAVSGLAGLEVPPGETNAIVTFHYYEPNLFLMQGQEWAGSDYRTTGITWPGPPDVPVTPAAGVSQWVRDWIGRYNTVASREDNPAGYKIVRDQIAQAAAWGAEHGRPLWMSEFCAQNGGDLTSRANWTRFVREQLEDHEIPWSIWSLLSDRGSYVYDRTSGRWVQELTDALGLEVESDGSARAAVRERSREAPPPADVPGSRRD